MGDQLAEVSNEELLEELRQRLNQGEFADYSAGVGSSEYYSSKKAVVSLWGIFAGAIAPGWVGYYAVGSNLDITFDEPLNGIRGLTIHVSG